MVVVVKVASWQNALRHFALIYILSSNVAKVDIVFHSFDVDKKEIEGKKAKYQ